MCGGGGGGGGGEVGVMERRADLSWTCKSHTNLTEFLGPSAAQMSLTSSFSQAHKTRNSPH